MPKLMTNNIGIYYETFGNPSDPCIIFITGINGQLTRWPAEVIQGLVEKGFYIIIFDNRDVGLSHYYDHLETPTLSEAISAKQQGKNFQPPYTLEDMADDVIHLMDGLHIKKAHIAGISMGGMIAQILAIKYPERVLSLICIATTSGDPHLPPAKPEVLEIFFAPKKSSEDLESYVANRMQLHKIYHHHYAWDEKKAEEMFVKEYQRAYHPEGFRRQLLAVMCSEPRGEKLKKLQVRSLIIQGDYDPVFSIEHGMHLANCLANSHLEIIEKMGHGLPENVYKKVVGLMLNHLK